MLLDHLPIPPCCPCTGTPLPHTSPHHKLHLTCGAVLEVWDRCRLLKELHVPKALHGAIYNDGWFGTGEESVGWGILPLYW